MIIGDSPGLPIKYRTIRLRAMKYELPSLRGVR